MPLPTWDECVREHVRMAHSARIVARRVPKLNEYLREIAREEMELARGIRHLQREGILDNTNQVNDAGDDGGANRACASN